jgi:hypothetical protein
MRPAVPVEEVLYKSPYRWTAPRILICDDNSLDEGETVHVRSDRITIVVPLQTSCEASRETISRARASPCSPSATG